MKASAKAGCLWSLSCAVVLAVYTALLNRLDEFLDVVLLWIYIQIPLAIAGILGGIVVSILVRGFEKFSGRRFDDDQRFALAFSVLISGTAAFLALSAARANFWYTRTYPWVDSWGEMLVVVLISLIAVCLIGIAVLLASMKLIRFLLRLRERSVRLHTFVGTTGFVILLFLGSSVVAGHRNQIVQRPDRLPSKSQGCERLVVIGVDGMIPEIIDDMMASGELPNFSAMAQNGYYGPLESTQPTNSPVIWTSIATGLGRYHHGVMNFLVQHPRGMKDPIRTFPSHMGLNTTFLMRKFYGSNLVDTYPVAGSLRRAATLWEIASAYGLRCGVINWWPSWPALELNGFLVSDSLNEHVALLNRAREAEDAQGETGPVEKFGFSSSSEVTWPPDLADEIRERVERDDWESADDVHLMELGLELCDRFNPQLFMIYLHGPDLVQHLFWDAFEPNLYRDVDPEYIQNFKEKIPDAYRTADRLVGDLRAQMGEDTTIVVLSDHGASPVFTFLSFWGYKAGHEHSPPGALLAIGPGIRPGVQTINGSVYDIAPTILNLLGISPSTSMKGRVLTEILIDDDATPRADQPPSWDFLAQQQGSAVPPSAVSKEKEEALRALGYIN